MTGWLASGRVGGHSGVKSGPADQAVLEPQPI
jgi:hypothetical protein